MMNDNVQEAIKWFRFSKVKFEREFEVVKNSKSDYRHDALANTIKTFNLAIQALQAYQPVAISKTETTSCEWCELEPSEKIFAYGMGFRKMPSNFCPNCGRRLN